MDELRATIQELEVQIEHLQTVIQNGGEGADNLMLERTNTNASLSAPGKSHTRTATREATDELFKLLENELDSVLEDDDGIGLVDFDSDKTAGANDDELTLSEKSVSFRMEDGDEEDVAGAQETRSQGGGRNLQNT